MQLPRLFTIFARNSKVSYGYRYHKGGVRKLSTGVRSVRIRKRGLEISKLFERKENDTYVESDVRERIQKLESYVRGRTPAEIAEARSAYHNDNYHGPGIPDSNVTFFLRL